VCNIYDLSPEVVGTFDVVICGTLLLHLRDPIRALEAVRSVTDGVFISSEQLEPWTTLVGRGRPLFKLDGSGQFCQWWLANAAGHRRMLFSAGFAVEQASKAYINRFNAHPKPAPTPRALARHAAQWAMTGDRHSGIFHRALLARPRL
jgi:tRNA (mo5U34)-methyltransferase